MAGGGGWAAAARPGGARPPRPAASGSIPSAAGGARLRPGDQLPTVRQLAVALRINANTVAKVYTHLERSGVLETRRGVGTFVVDAPDSAANHKARDAELRAIVTRALAEASARGFSASDLRRELQ